MKTAKLKSSGKIYVIGPRRPCGTKEENEERMKSGQCFWGPDAYGRVTHSAWLLKNGKQWGRVRTFFADQLDMI